MAAVATEEMLDALREGRFYVEPRMQHILAMHLVALEWAEAVALSLHRRGPREIAAEAKARLRHAALVRSYGPRPVAEVPALAKAA